MVLRIVYCNPKVCFGDSAKTLTIEHIGSYFMKCRYCIFEIIYKQVCSTARETIEMSPTRATCIKRSLVLFIQSKTHCINVFCRNLIFDSDLYYKYWNPEQMLLPLP